MRLVRLWGGAENEPLLLLLPFPLYQTCDWVAIADSVPEQLLRVTAFAAVSVQPNSGAVGEH